MPGGTAAACEWCGWRRMCAAMTALTATVLCRSAVLPAAALLGSSAGEAAATASSAAGGSRRRQC